MSNLYVEFTPENKALIRQTLLNQHRKIVGTHQGLDHKTYFEVESPTVAELVNQITIMQIEYTNQINTLKALVQQK